MFGLSGASSWRGEVPIMQCSGLRRNQPLCKNISLGNVCTSGAGILNELSTWSVRVYRAVV